MKFWQAYILGKKIDKAVEIESKDDLDVSWPPAQSTCRPAVLLQGYALLEQPRLFSGRKRASET